MHFGAGRFECLSSKLYSLSLSLKEMSRLKYIITSQVSAGHAHSAAITTDGELYCWGNNKGGCCGQPLATRSVVQYDNSFFVCSIPANTNIFVHKLVVGWLWDSLTNYEKLR